MTAAQELSDLLRQACSAADPELIASSLGTARPPDTSIYSAYIEPTVFPSFRSLSFRPWTADDFGLVEITLSEGVSVPVSDLQRLLGPLSPVPRLHGSPRRLQGIFESADLPAWAAVYLDLGGPPGTDDSFVTAISIRTEPPEVEE